MNERRRERLSAFLEDQLPTFFRMELDVKPGVLISILFIEVVLSGSRANIFVSVYPESEKEGVVKLLKIRENDATHFIRTRLGTKYAPAIRFHVR